MKASDIPEAFRLQQNVKHCADFLANLEGEPAHIQVGGNTITVATDDPQRPLLNQALTDLANYIGGKAQARLAEFELQADEKPSDITGFAEDDLPPPVDPS